MTNLWLCLYWYVTGMLVGKGAIPHLRLWRGLNGPGEVYAAGVRHGYLQRAEYSDRVIYGQPQFTLEFLEKRFGLL